VTVAERSDRVVDEDVKLVLDNCRLDYVFEPDRERLLARVCDLLASAKTVAWWQDGGADGAPEAWVLADPAARFVRDNVNVFLLGCPIEQPLPIVADGEATGELRLLQDTWRQAAGRGDLVTAAFLRDRSEPVTGPRMAVQAFFSSAIDALVVGRFLLMKDYWLMRMPQGAASGKAREGEIRLLQARA
jgi:predicted NodU family carbamoyl transferase